jgi:transformation/transcription domain-associated protein
MKEPGTANTPLTKHVHMNVDYFIRRATLMGYIGENKDKVGLALIIRITVGR